MARKKAAEYESGQTRTQVDEVIKAKKRLAKEAAAELELLKKGTAEYKEQLKKVKELNKESDKGKDQLDKGLKTHKEHTKILDKRVKRGEELFDLSKNITKSAMKQVGGWKKLDSLSSGIAENARMGASFQEGFSSSGEDLTKTYGMTALKLQEVGGHFTDISGMQSTSYDLATQAAEQWDKIGTSGFSMEGFQSQLTGLQEEANAKREEIKQMAEGAKGVDPALRAQLMAELKVLEDTTKGLQEKGQEMVRLDTLTKSATSELVGPFEKMQGVLKSMPMGGFINDFAGLDGVVSDFGKNTAKSMKVFLQSGGENKLMLNNIKNEGMKAADAIGKGFSQVAKLLLANPIMILVAGLALAGKMMWDFAKGAAELHNETGLAYGESARLHGIIKTTSMEMTGLGVSSEDVKEAAMGISDMWGGFGSVTKENVKNVAMLQSEFGIAGSTAADLAVQMQSVGAGSKEAAIEQLKSVGHLARASGVAPAHIMEEVAQNSEMFSQFAKDGGKNVFKAAIQAKKLGVSMDSIAGSADSLLDFESSINSQMEASMLLGRNINTDKARQLAFEGDLAGMQKEILKQAGSEAEWNSLNVVQRKSMAEAFGLSTDEMGRMIANQENLNNMSQVEKDTMEMKEGIIENLKKAWSNIVASVTQLWPLIVGFATPLIAVVVALGVVLKIIGEIAGFFTGMGTTGQIILGVIGAWVSWSLLFGKSLMGPIKMMGGMLGNVNKILFGEKAITLEKLKQTKAFKSVSKLAGDAKQKIMGRVDEIKGKVSGKAKDAIATDGTTTPDKTKKATKKKKSTSRKGGGKGKGPLGGMFEKFDAKKALAGAAALLIIAAALWVTAKALIEFGKVSWGAMAKAGVALLGLVLVLAAIGAIMMSGVGALAIIAGAAAMLIMAAALLVLGIAIQAIGKGFDMLAQGLGSFIPTIMTLAPMAKAIFVLAGAFTALGYSMAAMALGALALLPALPILMTLAAIGMLGGAVLGGGGGEETAAAEGNPVELKLDETNQKLERLIGLMGEQGPIALATSQTKTNTGKIASQII